MAPRLIVPTAAELIPADASLPELEQIARGCQACPLWERGTQTVWGEGVSSSPLMLVGEQPGNDEDLAGKPFVGPAGQLLNESLEAAGIDRSQAYVTNVVKHFKWEARGKRRIHSKPNTAEITACVPWLIAEIKLVRPKLVVCLGATAAQALLGKTFRVTQSRGQIQSSLDAPPMMATVHPSSILRAEDEISRQKETVLFIEDLRIAQNYLAA